MMQAMLSHALVLFGLHGVGVDAPPKPFCSTEPPTRFSAARTARIVRDAEVVVRAVALGSASGRVLKPWDSDTFAFDVREVLKGRGVADTLQFRGILADWDDFQEGPVPYLSHWGRYVAGSCISSFYRIGAEYLLLLGRRKGDEGPGELTPYWQILAPTKEQIRGPDDPWVAWVRQQLAARPPR